MFQKRYDGSEDFYRNRADYINGFGPLRGEFWWGLKNLRTLTDPGRGQGSWLLRVDVEDWEGNTAYAEYSMFSVQAYAFFIEGFVRGTAGKPCHTPYKGLQNGSGWAMVNQSKTR